MHRPPDASGRRSQTSSATRLVLALLALVAACAGAAGATPEAVADLRDHGFAFIAHRLEAGPIDDVPWTTGMTVSVEAIDLPRGLLTAVMGKSRMQLPLKTIDTRQLAHLLARGAGGRRPDLDGCAMAAAAYRLVGDAEAARLALEAAKLHETGVDERFAGWSSKLGLDEPAAKPAEAQPPGAGEKPARAGKETKEKDAAKAMASGAPTRRHAISKDHPRLFGPRTRLQALAQEREPAFQAMLELARKPSGFDYNDIPSLAFSYAVTGDKALGRAAIDRCLPLIRGPIRVGHETFGGDLAMCAFAYDGCYDLWTAGEKADFHAYFGKTVDANVGSETSPFHNGWWGYKNWGIGLASYATWHEDPRAPEFLKALEADYAARAAPALELAGDGGGWAEGHYLQYWLCSWLMFTESARLCEGVDYYAQAPRFYGQRALCSLFDVYPGDKPEELNRPIPRGDGGYGEYGWVVENVLAARRILCGYYKGDPVHQAIAAYNDRVPGNCIPSYAWRTWLFDDHAYPRGDAKALPLSHLAAGPGDVYARSSWDGDATWFFFHCGDRFTTHQHLDVGHFMIWRRQPLLGDAGVYDDFAGDHATNFYLRSIAHNTILIHDPAEKFPSGIRAFAGSTANDGGQAYPWLGTPIGHNGAAADPAAWQANKALLDTGDLLAFDDGGAYVYTAGDGTKAYAPEKCALFTRQIVFLRPSTFVVFDRVRSRRPDQKKYWIANLQVAPAALAQPLVSTNGDGRLFLQTVLPADPEITLHSGAGIYAFFGQDHPPTKGASGPVPDCRVEVSAKKEEEMGLFLHVLTAADATLASVPLYAAKVKSGEVSIVVGPASIAFSTTAVGGTLTINGAKHSLAPNLK